MGILGSDQNNAALFGEAPKYSNVAVNCDTATRLQLFGHRSLGNLLFVSSQNPLLFPGVQYGNYRTLAQEAAEKLDRPVSSAQGLKADLFSVPCGTTEVVRSRSCRKAVRFRPSEKPDWATQN